MQCDVRRVICISNKAEYLHKEWNYKNSTTEVILIRFQVIFATQTKIYWTNVRFIRPLKVACFSVRAQPL